MDNEEYATLLIIKLLLLTMLLICQVQQQQPASHRLWQLPVIARREEEGVFYTLYDRLRDGSNPARCHHEYFRMSKETFDYILMKIEPRITKQDTQMRTLHYLAEGPSLSSVRYHWRLGKSTVASIIYETSDAIWDELMPMYMATPSTIPEWKRISQGFQDIWNFPHCLGAIDGKHVRIQCPSNAGSEFFNYKQFHSINLMAVCDANLKFIVVDVGQRGRWSDSGVFETSAFGNSLTNSQIPLPPDEPLPGAEGNLSYAFIGDEAFPLKTWLLRPFPGRDLTDQRRIYNYRLSKARRTIENAFGVLSARWRLLHRPIIGLPDNAVKLVKAMYVLHNILRTRESNIYTPGNMIDTDNRAGDWRTNRAPLIDIAASSSRNSAAQSSTMRDKFVDYFMTPEGALEYQMRYIQRLQ